MLLLVLQQHTTMTLSFEPSADFYALINSCFRALDVYFTVDIVFQNSWSVKQIEQSNNCALTFAFYYNELNSPGAIFHLTTYNAPSVLIISNIIYNSILSNIISILKNITCLEFLTLQYALLPTITVETICFSSVYGVDESMLCRESLVDLLKGKFPKTHKLYQANGKL